MIRMSLKRKQFRVITDALFAVGVLFVLVAGALNSILPIDMLFVLSLVIAFWAVLLLVLELWAAWSTLCSKWEKLVYFVRKLRK